MIGKCSRCGGSIMRTPYTVPYCLLCGKLVGITPHQATEEDKAAAQRERYQG